MSTTEQLSEIVERVREATKSMSGDEFRLREIAFEKLLEHELSGEDIANGSSTSTAPQARPQETSVDTSYSTPTMRAEAVAQYFKIGPGDASDLFDLSDESPTLSVPSKQITNKSRAAAVRQIALLICGARTALGLETGTSHIREAAEAYSKFDPNFMKHLTEYDKIAVRGKPSSRNRLVRMRVIGAEEAQTVAQRMVSNGD
ncbi:MAG: hypothetical protein F4Z51_07890 [Chloroflexi bacterium]|nr:hypothetical protein [Chloroflexota bacterium]MYD17829.1 hypothetical protein [Chloroflexota bacterium]